MKKVFVLLITLSCLLSLAACRTVQSETHTEETWAEDWGIHMTVENVSSTGLTLIISQSGGIAEGRLETGADYYLERSDDGMFWDPVTTFEEPVWDMMSRILHSGEDLKFELDWSWLYGTLEAGQYRICKTFTLYGETGAQKSQFFCEEFEVK